MSGIGRRRVAAARRAYAALPPEHRRVLALRYVGDLPDDAIASLLGASPAEVSDLLTAARADLLRRPLPRLGRPAVVAAGLAFAALATAPGVHLRLPSSPAAPAPGAPVPGTEAFGPRSPSLVDTTDPLVPDAAEGWAAGTIERHVATVRLPHGRCTVCLPDPGGPVADKVLVPLPDDVAEYAGTREITISHEFLPLCRTVPVAAPNGAIRCVPGHT